MQFVRNRDFRVSFLGHSLFFKKDVPLYVPPEVRGEVRKYGGHEVEGQEDDGLEVSRETSRPHFPTPDSEPQAEDRQNRIFEAFRYLVSENDSNKFGANGMPKLTPIADIIHFRIDARERNQMWEAFNAEKTAQANPTNQNTAPLNDS